MKIDTTKNENNMTKEKLVYKVWDKTKEKYICPNGKKSQWNSIIWATAALKDAVNPGWGSKRSPDDYEIHTLKMVIVESVSGREAYDAKEKKARAEKLKQQQIEELKNHIKVIIPNVDLWRIREMLKNKIFSETVSRNLTVIFNKITDLEWPVK